MTKPIGVCPVLWAFGTSITDAALLDDAPAAEPAIPTLEYTLDCDTVERERAAYLAGEICRIAISEDCYAARAAAEIALTEVNYRNNARIGADALSEAIWYLVLLGNKAAWIGDATAALHTAVNIRSKVFCEARE